MRLTPDRALAGKIWGGNVGFWVTLRALQSRDKTFSPCTRPRSLGFPQIPHKNQLFIIET